MDHTQPAHHTMIALHNATSTPAFRSNLAHSLSDGLLQTHRSMAPKKAVSKDGSHVTIAKKRKKPASPSDPIPEKNLVDSALGRGKPARIDFPQDVAAASGLDVAVVHKVLDAPHIVVGRHIREKNYCRIPNMVQLRLQILPARAACTKLAFGKEIQVKARGQAIKKVFVSALKPLKEAVVG